MVSSKTYWKYLRVLFYRKIWQKKGLHQNACLETWQITNKNDYGQYVALSKFSSKSNQICFPKFYQWWAWLHCSSFKYFWAKHYFSAGHCLLRANITKNEELTSILLQNNLLQTHATTPAKCNELITSLGRNACCGNKTPTLWLFQKIVGTISWFHINLHIIKIQKSIKSV